MYITSAGVLEVANIVSTEIAGDKITVVTISEFGSAIDYVSSDLIKNIIHVGGGSGGGSFSYKSNEIIQEERLKRIILEDSELVAIVELTLQHFIL